MPQRHRLHRRVSCLAAALLLALPTAAPGAFDAFLKIDGVPGESQDARHEGEIDVLSWSWGVAPGGATAGSRAQAASRPCVQDFQLVKVVDKATPILLSQAVVGTHYPKATLTVRKRGGDQQEFLVVKFEDLLVSSVQAGGSGDAPLLVEKVSLRFGELTFSYKAEKPDGSLEAAVEGVVSGSC